jgi:(S)-sulfolactate dehydrogenase
MDDMKKIVIAEFMDEAAVAMLQQQFQVVYDPALVDQPVTLLKHMIDCNALIIRNKTQITAEFIAQCPSLRVIGRLGVGLENINLDAAYAHNIDVIPATGANAQAVAEYVLCMAMILLRPVVKATTALMVGEWPRQQYSQGLEIYGKQLGLVGFGSIGRLTAHYARTLGLKVMAYDPILPVDDPVWEAQQVMPADLPTLLTRCDIVSLHLPLNADTYHLLDEAALAMMKPTAILINTARGGIVDEFALVQALVEQRLAGAALDVFEQEPLIPRDEFQHVPHLILTPHVAGVTQESNARVSQMVAEKIEAILLHDSSVHI